MRKPRPRGEVTCECVLSPSFLLMFCHLGPYQAWGDCPSQGQPILTKSKQFTCELTHHMQTNQSGDHPSPPLWALILQATITLPSSPRTGCQTTRNSPCAQEPTELIQAASPKPAHPASPAPTTETTVKARVPVLLPLPPKDPGASPCGPV